MEEKEKIYDLIIKELNSSISKEEKIHLNKEIANSSEFEEIFPSIQEYWTNFYPKNKPHSIIERTEEKLGFTYRQNQKTNFRLLLKIAAIVIFIISFSFSTYQFLRSKQKLVLNEYSCAAGEIKKITLSDGTTVWLNSKSFLIASEPFIGDSREVKLFGEAYFEVTHNEEQPFIVTTPQLKTRVLGTHFNIVAYPTDEIHEISLHEGKIQLQTKNNKNTKVILKPGERAYFTTETGKIKVINTDLGKPAKWRDGILRFYDEDLLSITKKLERKFHTRIFITDTKVGELRFSAEFDIEPLEKILKLLNKAHKFNYEKTENGIIIQANSK